MVTEYISVLLIQIVLHFRWTDLLDWKNTQLLHQLQKKVTYSLNFTLGNCKNPGLVTVILGYRMLAPSRVPAPEIELATSRYHDNNSSKKAKS